MTVIRFNEFIKEALLPSQFREYVKDFDPKKYEDLFKNFDGEHDRKYYRIYLPMPKTKSETEVAIEDFLNDNDYEIVDYIQGRAKFKDAKNTSRIGQILQRLERTDDYAKELSKKFIEDPYRKAGEDLMVCITRHAYDVAGSDTDRNWSNCLTIARTDTKRYTNYIKVIKNELSKVNLKTLGEEIDSILENDDELYEEIEKVDIDPFFSTGDELSGVEKSIIDELENNSIYIDSSLLVRYEDEDGLCETENIEFNDLVDKYNNIIDLIQNIDKYITNGTNVRYIQTHVRSGVLISYLIRKDDKNINDPIANLDIKPYVNVFDSDDIFLLSDTRMYGHGTRDYKNTVDTWLKSVNKDKFGIYRLSDGIYNDNLQNKTIIVEKDGSVIDNTALVGSHSTDYIKKLRSYKIDSKTLSMFKDKVKDLSIAEAEEFFKYVMKSFGDILFVGDIRSKIKSSIPKSLEKAYEKTIGKLK